MRLGIFCFVGLLLSAGLASGQTPKPGSPSPTPKPTLPELRPALIGTAPNSLINTIDTADLIKKGQKEAAVMFSCLVAPTGQIVTSGAYRGTRGSELLEQELLKRLATAKFIPAIHNHQPVIAVFYGTVKFAVVNGKPRLRIFANQQLEEVDKETDFIGPQAVRRPGLTIHWSALSRNRQHGSGHWRCGARAERRCERKSDELAGLI